MFYNKKNVFCAKQKQLKSFGEFVFSRNTLQFTNGEFGEFQYTYGILFNRYKKSYNTEATHRTHRCSLN